MAESEASSTSQSSQSSDTSEPNTRTPTEVIGIVPTIYADTWHYAWWKGHIKIAFGEKIRGQRFYRTAVVLETSDIRRLIKNLEECLRDLGEEGTESAES